MVSALERSGRDERGAVLVLVAIMMTCFLGMAALAIDLGYFDQQQRQAHQDVTSSGGGDSSSTGDGSSISGTTS